MTQLKYQRSKKWVITLLYSHQKERSKQRGHHSPKYSKMEFRDWVFSQPNFNSLYEEWVINKYNREYAVSVDRIDDNIWYCFENIRLVSWSVNRKKYCTDRVKWINNSVAKAVRWTHVESWTVIEFFSASQAQRNTWICRWHIGSCCNWKELYKTAWWYKWEYIINK